MVKVVACSFKLNSIIISCLFHSELLEILISFQEKNLSRIDNVKKLIKMQRLNCNSIHMSGIYDL